MAAIPPPGPRAIAADPSQQRHRRRRQPEADTSAHRHVRAPTRPRTGRTRERPHARKAARAKGRTRERPHARKAARAKGRTRERPHARKAARAKGRTRERPHARKAACAKGRTRERPPPGLSRTATLRDRRCARHHGPRGCKTGPPRTPRGRAAIRPARGRRGAPTPQKPTAAVTRGGARAVTGLQLREATPAMPPLAAPARGH